MCCAVLRTSADNRLVFQSALTPLPAVSRVRIPKALVVADGCIVSLFKVKEVGVSLEDCSCLAQDAQRIFGVYWSLGGVNASVPPFWPDRLTALSSSHNPLQLRLNGVSARVYLSVSFTAEESLGIYCLQGQQVFCMWGKLSV